MPLLRHWYALEGRLCWLDLSPHQSAILSRTHVSLATSTATLDRFSRAVAHWLAQKLPNVPGQCNVCDGAHPVTLGRIPIILYGSCDETSSCA